MSRALLLVGLEGLHHDQRWRALCTELGLTVYFHSAEGLVQALTGLGDPFGGAMDDQTARQARYERERLADLIDRLNPFAVHALGSHPAGFLCHDAVTLSQRRPPMIVHIRGGAEIELYRHSPMHEAKFRIIFANCAAVIGDSQRSYAFAREFGFHDPLGTDLAVSVPGNCGDIRIDAVRSSAPADKPIIIWPKAFTNPNVDPYPIIEAIARVWEQSHYFRLVAYGLEWPELLYWARKRLSTVPKADFEPRPTADRKAFLAALRKADILLSPTLFDGISNVLLEAMACGCIPIVSRHAALPDDLVALDTLLFADNLAAGEIETAIAAALAFGEKERGRRAAVNAEWVGRHCDRDRILRHSATLYHRLGGPLTLTGEGR